MSSVVSKRTESEKNMPIVTVVSAIDRYEFVRLLGVLWTLSIQIYLKRIKKLKPRTSSVPHL